MTTVYPRVTSNPRNYSEEEDDDDALFESTSDELSTVDNRRGSITFIPCQFCHAHQPIADLEHHQLVCSRNTRRQRIRHVSPRTMPPEQRRRVVSDNVVPGPSAPVRARTPSPTEDFPPPENLICPITRELFRDPVLATDSYTYERSAIENWLRTTATSPTTRAPLSKDRLVLNLVVKNMVDDFRAECRRRSLYKYRLDVDVKKTEVTPYMKTKTKSIYRAKWTTKDSSATDSSIVLTHLTDDKAEKIANLHNKPGIHPNIIRVLGRVEHPDAGILFLQESPSAETLSHVMKNNPQKLSLKTRDMILYQILSALQYLTNENCMYGHITADHVFVYQLNELPENTLVKLSTFDNTEELIKRIPPEFVSKDNYSEKSHVYAFGLLAQELYSLELESDDVDLTTRQTLYESCLVADPKDRPTFLKLKNLFHNLIGRNEEFLQSSSSE
ncbi:hypothetical protein I4U23_019248 [Adineta vaga]|nr:hypothetical protein I4U23_019248 [Adineta vaga]